MIFEPKLTIEGATGAGTVVLANSLAASNAMWATQVAAWRTTHRIVRFDYAGHGGTSDSGAPTRIDGIAMSLLAALDGVGIQRFAFVGLSIGGLVGLRLAASVPARVERLVVANSRWTQTGATRAPWAERIAAVRKHGIGAIADATLERWFTAEFRARAPQAVAGVRAMILRTSAEGYAAAAQAVRDSDARPWLAQIRCLALVVGGDQDAAAPPEHLQELAQALNARHLRLAPCAHLSNIEQADAFTAEVGAFLLNPRIAA